MRGLLFLLALIPIQASSQALVDTSLLLTSKKYDKEYAIFYSDFEKEYILKEKAKHEKKKKFVFYKNRWIQRKEKINSKK